MYRGFSDMILDILARDQVEMRTPTDQAHNKLLAEILDTIKNIEEHQQYVNFGQLYDWLEKTMWSLAGKGSDVAIAKIASAVRLSGYSLQLLEQEWETTCAGIQRDN